jgi:uncharacterized lipoprotein YajG
MMELIFMQAHNSTTNMKKYLLLLVTVFVFTASQAQYVPDSIANKLVTVSLKMKYHEFIVGSIQDKGTIDAFKYVNQLAAANPNSTSIDTSLNVSVTVSYGYFTKLYKYIGSQQYRISNKNNDNIKQLLVGQIYTNPAYTDLLQALAGIDNSDDNDTQAIENAGGLFILSIKQ